MQSTHKADAPQLGSHSSTPMTWGNRRARSRVKSSTTSSAKRSTSELYDGGNWEILPEGIVPDSASSRPRLGPAETNRRWRRAPESWDEVARSTTEKWPSPAQQAYIEALPSVSGSRASVGGSAILASERAALDAAYDALTRLLMRRLETSCAENLEAQIGEAWAALKGIEEQAVNRIQVELEQASGMSLAGLDAMLAEAHARLGR